MKRILILEDDLLIQAIYRNILSSKYHITIVDSVDDAIAMNETNDYELYIVDLILKEGAKTGVNFIETGISPLIIVSVLELTNTKLETVFNYLRKPFNDIELLTKIEEILSIK